MGESGSFFEVADGEFNDGVLAVLGVDQHDGLVAVGDRHVVAPVGEQGGLVTDQAGAAHDEAHGYGWLLGAASGGMPSKRPGLGRHQDM